MVIKKPANLLKKPRGQKENKKQKNHKAQTQQPGRTKSRKQQKKSEAQTQQNKGNKKQDKQRNQATEKEPQPQPTKPKKRAPRLGKENSSSKAGLWFLFCLNSFLSALLFSFTEFLCADP